MSFESYIGVNNQAQHMQPDPLPRHVDGVLEDGVIGGILNIDLGADEHL